MSLNTLVGLQINNTSTMPATTTLVGEQLIFYNEYGLLMVYDPVRGRWLSVYGQVFGFEVNRNNPSDEYMATYGGSSMDLTGYIMPRNAVITALSIQTTEAEPVTWWIELRKNDSATPIYSLPMANEQSTYVDDLNIDLFQDDRLQAYVETQTGNSAGGWPILLVEICWTL